MTATQKSLDHARMAAAQCWCDPETSSIEMAPLLAEAFARRLAVWIDTAAQFCRNADFYRGLLDQTAAHLGSEVYRRDDGTLGDIPLRIKIPELVAALKRPATPLPAVVQVPQGWKLVPVEPTDAMVDAARSQSSFPAGVYAAMLTAAPEAPAQGSEWLPLTPEEQNRLDGLLKHARWLAASMPAMDGLQHSWALNARQAMVRMHDWLKMYLPPTTPRASEAPAQEKSNG